MILFLEVFDEPLILLVGLLVFHDCLDDVSQMRGASIQLDATE